MKLFYIFTGYTKFPNCAQRMHTNLFLDYSFLDWAFEVHSTYGFFPNFDILCKNPFLLHVWSFSIFLQHTKFPNCAQRMCTNLFLYVSFLAFTGNVHGMYDFFPNFDISCEVWFLFHVGSFRKLFYLLTTYNFSHGTYNFFPNFDLLFFGFWKWRSRCVLFFWPHTNRFCVTLCSYLNFFLFFHYETCSLNV